MNQFHQKLSSYQSHIRVVKKNICGLELKGPPTYILCLEFSMTFLYFVSTRKGSSFVFLKLQLRFLFLFLCAIYLIDLQHDLPIEHCYLLQLLEHYFQTALLGPRHYPNHCLSVHIHQHYFQTVLDFLLFHYPWLILILQNNNLV